LPQFSEEFAAVSIEIVFPNHHRHRLGGVGKLHEMTEVIKNHEEVIAQLI